MPRRSKVEELKNLEVSVAVVGSTSLEILRYTQDDIESEKLPRLRLAMTADSVLPARRCFALLSMT